MAIHIETGDFGKSTRDDVHCIDPRAVVVNWGMNLSRGGQRPPVDEALISLAEDMKPKKGPGDTADGSSGQLNPVLGRMLPDRRVEVVGGFRRTAAALHLIESGKCPDFKLKISVKKLSDAEAALANMQENLEREDPTPLQLAHGVRSLHEDYGMAMADIAKRLKRSENWLNQIMNLTVLPAEIQTSVQSGETSVSAALNLAKIDGPAQREVFNAAKTSGGKKVTAEAVKDAQRKKVEAARKESGVDETSETSEAANTNVANVAADAKSIKRNIKHLRAFLESRTGPAESKSGKSLAEWLIKYLDGDKSEESLHGKWDRVFPSTAEKAAS